MHQKRKQLVVIVDKMPRFCDQLLNHGLANVFSHWSIFYSQHGNLLIERAAFLLALEPGCHVMVARCPPVLEHICVRESIIVTEGEKTFICSDR